jgi:hypothetical protein
MRDEAVAAGLATEIGLLAAQSKRIRPILTALGF